MTVTSGSLPAGGGADPADGREAQSSAALARGICPYLTGEDGAWRSAIPIREQRCGALNPPAPLTLDKQRSLCLVNAHMTCATYRAARGIEIGASPPSPAVIAERIETGATRWVLARTSPLLLDRNRVASVSRLARQRTGAQLALGGLMALALAAIVLARLPGAAAEPPAAGGGASGSPTASIPPVTATPRPTPRPTPSPSASAPASPAPSIVATPVPASPPPAAGQTYRVRAGDTLSSIASRFGTTVVALQRANGMGNTTHLDIGQVLKIP